MYEWKSVILNRLIFQMSPYLSDKFIFIKLTFFLVKFYEDDCKFCERSGKIL